MYIIGQVEVGPSWYCQTLRPGWLWSRNGDSESGPENELGELATRYSNYFHPLTSLTFRFCIVNVHDWVYSKLLVTLDEGSLLILKGRR